MELSFSQKMGLKPVKSLIQVNSMDEDLRNALWNDVTLQIWYSTSTNVIDDFLRTIWMHYFKRLIDLVPGNTNELKKEVKGSFFQFKWYEVYDFIEFVANNFPYEYAIDKFLIACNTSLQKELSAYRFVGKKLTQITSEQEISEIEEALEISKQYTQHLDRALELLADRKSPDFRNSIKESISAVEAICQLITGNSKATLGKALGLLEDKLGTVHPALKEAFSKLYGYTNDDQGIRHALIGESNLSAEDAKFMLIACSAFINYLVSKADKAGIELSQTQN